MDNFPAAIQPQATPSDNPSWAHLTIELAERSLTHLREPARYNDRITETFRIESSDLIREVNVSITLPDSGAQNRGHRAARHAHQEFIFVAMQPRKTDVVDIQFTCDTTGFSARRLSHDAHIQFSELLLLARFKGFLALLTPEPDHEGLFTQLSYDALTCLSRLANANKQNSRKNYNKLFRKASKPHDRSAGLLIRLVDQSRSRSTADVRNTLRYLKRLAVAVRDRYFLAYSVVGPASVQRVNFSYTYRRAVRDIVHRRKTQGRQWMRATTPAIRIHLPLAKLTNDFEAAMSAPQGYYFERRRVEFMNKADRLAQGVTSGGSRIYGMLKDDPAPRVLKQGVHFEPDTLRRAHVFIGGGAAIEKRGAGQVHLWVRLRERPPGSTFRALTIVGLSLLAMTSLLLWSYVYPLARSSLAPLLATLLSLGSYLAELTTPDAPLVRAPVRPRLILALQSLVALMFAVWLLGRTSGPPRPGKGFDWGILPHVWSSWHRFGGVVLVAITIWFVVLLRRRVSTGRKGYNRAARDVATSNAR